MVAPTFSDAEANVFLADPQRDFVALLGEDLGKRGSPSTRANDGKFQVSSFFTLQ